MIDYIKIGEGDPVLLIHGFLEEAKMWENWIEKAPKKYTYYSIKIPGHNSKFKWPKDFSIEEYAHQLSDYFSTLSSKKIKVIGHSLGGYIGLEVLKKNQSSEVMLLNSNFWEDSTIKKIERERVAKIMNKNFSFFLNEAIPNLFMKDKKIEHQRIINNLIERGKLMDKDSVINVLKAIKTRKDFSDFSNIFFGKISMIQGANDPLVSMADFKKKISSQKIQQVLIQDNAGHMSLWEESEKTYWALNNWLSKN